MTADRPYVLFCRDRKRGSHWHSVGRYATRKAALALVSMWKAAGDTAYCKVVKR